MTEGSALLRRLLESGLVSADDVRALMEAGPPSSCPTHSEFLPRVVESCRPTTIATYRAGFNRLVGAFGDRRLDQVRTGDLTELGVRVQQQVAAGGRSPGVGAVHNLADASRYFYRHAVACGVLATNPAAAMVVPPRQRRVRRALEEWEMRDVGECVATNSRDPELDLLLLEFHRETAARQGGAIGLKVGDLRLDRPSVTLLEKGGHQREVPASRDLQSRMLRLAEDRGATDLDDPVFFRAQHVPITRRKYNSLFGLVQRRLPWAKRLGLSIHWYRHTTLTDIARVTNSRVAAEYAGHADRSVTDVYTHVTFEDLRAAHAVLFR